MGIEQITAYPPIAHEALYQPTRAESDMPSMRIGSQMNTFPVPLSLIVAFGLMMGGAEFACAQTYPQRPIKLVVPFPAGGPNDTAARIVAQGLSSTLGQPVIIENQSGAGGTIGAKQAATATPDGHTLLMVVPSNLFGT